MAPFQNGSAVGGAGMKTKCIVAGEKGRTLV